MGSNGLVPSYLVFGCVPRFPAVDSKLPDQQSRMNALSRTRQEMATIVAETRIHEVLASRVSRTAGSTIQPGDKVRTYHKSDKKYVGPYPVIRVDREQVFVVIDDREVQFSIHQVVQAKTYDEIVNGEQSGA